MRSLIFSLFFFITYSVMGQLLLGQEYWQDGTLRLTEYGHGNRVYFVEYHENGRMKAQGCYRDGKQDGTWKQFTKTGSMLIKARFTSGKPQGVWEFRTETDRPLGQLYFRNGRLIRGEQFNEEGVIAARRVYP